VARGIDIRRGPTEAIKRLRTDLATHPTFQARFRREAQAAAGLNHPNIVSVYDTGEEMAPDGTHVQPYIVMEYVAGRTLRDVLNDGRKLLPERALEITSGVLAALDYSHRAGIIHRDVKPGNLMITGGPVGSGDLVVKLTDFGIARAIEQTRITQVGSVVGTAAYLAPEQVRGEEATPATDVYALGVVLYQFLTGRLPYEGSSLAELAVRQQNEKPLPPDTYNSEVPETLGAAVLRALEGDPNRRYASAGELAAGLRLGMEGGDVTLPLETGTAATNVLGGETAATRHMGRDTAQTEYRPAQSQTRRPAPRVAPAPAPARPAARAAQPRKRGLFSRFARFVLAAVALVLVAAAVATAVIVTTDKAAGVKVSHVAGETVDKVVEELKDLVNNNKE